MVPTELLYVSLKHRIGWLPKLIDARMFRNADGVFERLLAEAQFIVSLLEEAYPDLPVIWTSKYCLPDAPCIPR